MTLAYGALALTLAITTGALLSRWLVTPPSGTRRAPRVLEEPVTLADLLGPRGVYDLGWCPAEQTEHLHRYDADGTRTCCACQRTTPTAVPR
ncbi:hypothetical protein ACF1AE_25485 [Streptomyces sp. NPDC014986]|uniref:hypothetical protein n=1 Tax=Streptomyces sp. NPDC014986 TaxID=3364934 RepID=UPI0036F9EE81